MCGSKGEARLSGGNLQAINSGAYRGWLHMFTRLILIKADSDSEQKREALGSSVPR